MRVNLSREGERDALFRQNGEQVLNEGRARGKEIRREDDVQQSIWIDPMGCQSSKDVAEVV